MCYWDLANDSSKLSELVCYNGATLIKNKLRCLEVKTNLFTSFERQFFQSNYIYDIIFIIYIQIFIIKYILYIYNILHESTRQQDPTTIHSRGFLTSSANSMKTYGSILIHAVSNIQTCWSRINAHTHCCLSLTDPFNLEQHSRPGSQWEFFWPLAYRHCGPNFQFDDQLDYS